MLILSYTKQSVAFTWMPFVQKSKPVQQKKWVAWQFLAHATLISQIHDR